jgi:transcription elongation factor GreA-like protein/transcription elongation GreA/GreB family factor
LPIIASLSILNESEDKSLSYLKSFQDLVYNHDYPALLRLWEEYCVCDEIDPIEVKEILKSIKASEFGEPFGKHVEKILPLWEMLAESHQKHDVFKLIIDIETTNTEHLRQMVFTYLQSRYGEHKNFGEKIRLTGLRAKESFQGAASNFELLNHMMKGKFVFHTGGWGVGEITDVSFLREQLTVEFENVPGKKDLSFTNAFKTLIPIPDDHFLALRFGNPDLLEAKAKEHPSEVIRLLLRDLGPKSATEIKDELCEVVIPEADWAKWWQTARSRVKKDTLIDSPEDFRGVFALRTAEVSHEERLKKSLSEKVDAGSLIHLIYAFVRDFPEALKNADFKLFLQTKLQEALQQTDLTDAQTLQLHFFLEDLLTGKNYIPVLDFIKQSKNIEALIQSIDIVAFKKRTLVIARKVRPDWKELFLNLLLITQQNPLRDYLFLELAHKETLPDLTRRLEDLFVHPGRYPDVFIWYFQKIMQDKEIPFADKEGKVKFFEAFFVLLSHLEQVNTHRELIKRMQTMLSHSRYAIVRDILQSTSLTAAKEFLLLASKCHSLSDHDQKILHSLAEVVHPSLAASRKKESGAEEVIWTTEEGFTKIKKRIEEIATVETIAVAKDIEVARSHGDLRENAEFKAALEKRARLQSELKTLSDQLKRARVITKDDITTDEVGIGCIVSCKNPAGKTLSYTLLGPWDTDPAQGIVSFQSKLAQEMKGLKLGKTFNFQGETFTITHIDSYLDH